MNDPTIALWVFPPEDFADWRELVGTPEVATHAEYMTMLAAIQADQEHSGHTVVRVPMTVTEMRAELAAHGWPNTPDMRAAVTAQNGRKNLGL